MLVFGGVDEMLQDFVSSQSTTEDQPFLAKPYAILIVVFWSRSNRLSTQSMRNDKSIRNTRPWMLDASSLLPCLCVSMP